MKSKQIINHRHLAEKELDAEVCGVVFQDKLPGSATITRNQWIVQIMPGLGESLNGKTAHSEKEC